MFKTRFIAFLIAPALACSLVAPLQRCLADEAQSAMQPTSAPHINPVNGMLFITGVRSRIDLATGEAKKMAIDHASFYRTRDGEVVSLHSKPGSSYVSYEIVIRDAQYNIVETVTRAARCTPSDIPVLSPDGKTVAFVEWTPGRSGTSVYSRGGKYLVALPGMQPTDWAPNGSLLLVGFVSTNPGIYLSSPDLRSVRKISPEQAKWASASPDGKRIAYEVDSRVYVMNVDGSNVVTLTAGVTAERPVWSPDGKWLAVRSLSAFANTYGDHRAVFLLNPNTPLQQQLTPLKQANGLPIEISDGVMQWR